MTDLEKVVKGLECCQGGSCGLCPYDNITYGSCRHSLEDDALTLLKAQQPHVLTLEEVEDALDTVVWVDRPQIENSSDEYALITAYSRKLKSVELRFIDKGRRGWRRWSYEQYGKTWRCWDKRPYDEQRKAAKWNE